MNHEPRTMNRTCVAWLLIACSFFPAVAHAQIPHLIRYQGFLKDSQGVPLEGPYTLTFRLYPAATGGTPLWTEAQPGVAVTQGSFSVLLGSVTSLASTDWGSPLWLSIQVGADPELAPRQQITSVPLAIRAGVAESLTTPVTTSNITDDVNRLMPTGAIILWDGASCPAGYARLSSMDGKFLVSGSTSSAAAGGSHTKDLRHVHTVPSHTHPLPDVTRAIGWNTGAGYNFGPWGDPAPAVDVVTFNAMSTQGDGGQTTSASTTDLSAVDIRPAYATILLCKKN